MGLLQRLCSIGASLDLGHRICESRNRLFRLAYSWCGDRALAEDLAQETLERAWRHRNDIRDPDRLDAWLHSILHNCWRAYLRRQRPEVELDEELPMPEGDLCTNAARLERVHAVRQAILSLPVLQREVVTLVDLEGFGYAEVAEILEIPIGTVMSRLNRARQNLCKRLTCHKETQAAASAEAPATAHLIRSIR